MRSIGFIAILAALIAALFWLTRPTPTDVLRSVIGGQAPTSLALLETGWGSGPTEPITAFVHFRIAPRDLRRLIQSSRFREDTSRDFNLKGRVGFWKPPRWWDPTKLAGPVVRYFGVGPESHDDLPWTMHLFVDAAGAEVYGVREEWWR